MKSKIIFVFLCSSLLCNGCYPQSPNSKMISNELTRHGATLLVRNSGNDDSLYLAINLLDSAIKLDSTNYNSLAIKCQIECTLGKYEEAIKDINHILSIKKDYLVIKAAKGFIYEKMGNRNQAEKVYKEVLNDYNEKIKSDSNSIDDEINRNFIILLLDKDAGIKAFEILHKSYPNNKNINDLHETYYQFDREKFISSFCMGDVIKGK